MEGISDGNRERLQKAILLLLDEIELVADELNNRGTRALQSRDYDSARKVIEIATRLGGFRDQVVALQKELDEVFKPSLRSRRRRGPGSRKPRLPRGLRTLEKLFRRPILEALVESGGSAPSKEVLELVEKKMEKTLTPDDYKTLQSKRTLRWQNTARWCRQKLVEEGLMKSDSPRGVWEISEKGRSALETGKGL